MDLGSSTLSGILTGHFSRYPAMQVQDVYKLLFQAAMGSEHAIQNPQAARKWLEEEMVNLGDGPDEPLVDPISPGGIVRIHLRPYIQNGASLDALLDAFIRTANEFVATPDRLPAYGQLAVEMAIRGRLSFSSSRIGEFWKEMAGQGFPAVHHSKEYVAAYRPAYRVILWELLRDDRLPLRRFRRGQRSHF